jgi:RNA:NAD 2'-phosphotransferase (TPT1/KptA family)
MTFKQNSQFNCLFSKKKKKKYKLYTLTKKDVKDVERSLSGTLKASAGNNELRLTQLSYCLIMNPGKWM